MNEALRLHARHAAGGFFSSSTNLPGNPATANAIDRISADCALNCSLHAGRGRAEEEHYGQDDKEDDCGQRG